MTSRTSFNGDRLKAARLYNEMTIADVAEKTGISKQAISQFENKKSEPKLENLIKFIALFKFPRDYFYEEQKAEIFLGDTYFRSLASTTKKERISQIERIKILAAIYQVLSENIQFPKLNILKIPNKETDIEDIDLENLAMQVRQKWGLKDESINNIIDVMEQNGIIISSVLSKKGNIDAYSQVQKINGKELVMIVLGSDKESLFRRNFSAAHELGHILLDDFFDIDEMSKLEYRDMENIMNKFAGALLIPKDNYIRDLNTSSKTDLSYYIQLKKKYRVSAAALIVRARQLEEITTNQYQYLMKRLSQKGYRICEPFDKDTPVFEPRYLKEALKMIIEDNILRVEEFMDELSHKGFTLNISMVEELLNLENNYLNSKILSKNSEVINLKKK